jgi:hypothetical protein
MVDLGFENSRMKDFFDVWVLSREFPFEGHRLASAIAATFNRRETAIPAKVPVAFTPAFAEAPAKLRQWMAFLVRARVAMEPPTFPVVLDQVASFLWPAAVAAGSGTGFERTWPAGGPWKSAS